MPPNFNVRACSRAHLWTVDVFARLPLCPILASAFRTECAGSVQCTAQSLPSTSLLPPPDYGACRSPPNP